MKKTFSALLIFLSFSTFAETAQTCPTVKGITCNQTVMLNYGKRTIQTVKAIADGLYFLSDGNWYTREHIYPLSQELKGIRVGDTIMNNYFEKKKILKVEAISGGLFFLSDGSWYEQFYIHNLESELNGIHVGDTIMEDFGDRSFQTVVAISNGLFYLSDKDWYAPEYVNIVDCN